MADKFDLYSIRITGVKPKLHEELTNISKHMGVPLTSLLKPKLQDWANSFAPELRLPPPPAKTK